MIRELKRPFGMAYDLSSDKRGGGTDSQRPEPVVKVWHFCLRNERGSSLEVKNT